MSGGSFEYLCYQDAPNPDLLHEMSEALDSEGFSDAAAATMALIVKQDNPLRNVWRAMEWMASGDWGRDDLEEAIQTWRGGSQ